jgi:beta-mannosidase
MLLSQAETIIKRKRNHTALAIWCGGNELSDWEGNPVKDSDPLVGRLKELVNRLNPQRRWLPSSPSGGVFNNTVKNIEEHPDMLWDVHGPWEHQGLSEHCRLYNMGTSLLHSEFGVEGMTNRNALYKTVSEKHMLPAGKDNEIYFHRGAWWANEPLIQQMFGGLHTIDEIRTASQYLQYEGLKYAVECNRRRAFQNSGTFPWQFNEPYPNAYCTSSLDYYANPKPAYYGVRNSYDRVLVSASFESPSLFEKSEFSADFFVTTSLLDNELKKFGNISVRYELEGIDGIKYFSKENSIILPENSTQKIDEIRVPEGEIKSALFLLRLSITGQDGGLIAENEYLFTKEMHFGSVFLLPEPNLEYRQDENSLNIRNKGQYAALFLFLSCDDPLPQKDFLYFSKNYLCILPGEERSVELSADSGNISGKRISAESFLYRNDIILK